MGDLHRISTAPARHVQTASLRWNRMSAPAPALPRTIVVVEDEVTQRDMLVHYLSRHEFRVNGAEDGATLRRLVDRDLPSLVMLDIGLQAKTGSRWCAGCVSAVAGLASSW